MPLVPVTPSSIMAAMEDGPSCSTCSRKDSRLFRVILLSVKHSQHHRTSSSVAPKEKPYGYGSINRTNPLTPPSKE
jgi:hypothetical protein